MPASTLSHGDPCPGCGEPLTGLATKCWAGVEGCGWTAGSAAPCHERQAAPATDTRPEKAIQLGIKTALVALGFRVYDTSQPHAASITPGLPDLYVVGHGCHAWCEVKRPGGKLTAAQAEFQRLVGDNGGLAFVWRSEAEAIAWAAEVTGQEAA